MAQTFIIIFIIIIIRTWLKAFSFLMKTDQRQKKILPEGYQLS